MLPSSFRFDMVPITPRLSFLIGALSLVLGAFIGVTGWCLTSLDVEALKCIGFWSSLGRRLRSPTCQALTKLPKNTEQPARNPRYRITQR